jgi:hypothetical protein
MNTKGCYLLRTREFLNSNENIYKIGRSLNLNKRIKTYPNNSEIILLLNTKNEIETEKIIIKIFKKTFIQRKDIGYEYFEGNIEDMKIKFNNIIMFSNMLNELNINYNMLIENNDINISINKNKEILKELKENINENKKILKELDNKIKINIKKEKKEKKYINEDEINENIMIWFNKNYILSENKKNFIYIKDIYNLFRESDIFINLNKTDRLKYNKKYFVEYFETNTFGKYYKNRYQNKRNVITNYKIKE